MEEKSVFDKFEMQFDESAKGILKQIAKLASILSVLGFVVICVLGLAGLVLSCYQLFYLGMNGGVTRKVIALMYLILVVIYFFLVYYLKKFALNMKKGFRENNLKELVSSFEYLKFHFKYLIIFTISFILFFVYVILVTFNASMIKY